MESSAQIPKEFKEVKSFMDLLAGDPTVVKIEPNENGVLVYKVLGYVVSLRPAGAAAAIREESR